MARHSDFLAITDRYGENLYVDLADPEDAQRGDVVVIEPATDSGIVLLSREDLDRLISHLTALKETVK
jgi:hypothetical protein